MRFCAARASGCDVTLVGSVLREPMCGYGRAASVIAGSSARCCFWVHVFCFSVPYVHVCLGYVGTCPYLSVRCLICTRPRVTALAEERRHFPSRRDGSGGMIQHADTVKAIGVVGLLPGSIVRDLLRADVLGGWLGAFWGSGCGHRCGVTSFFGCPCSRAVVAGSGPLGAPGARPAAVRLAGLGPCGYARVSCGHSLASTALCPGVGVTLVVGPRPTGGTPVRSTSGHGEGAWPGT